MLRVEPVNPLAFVEEASGILREAWQPPCLDYSPAYLQWQFTFPGPGPAPAVACFAGQTPVGFAGVTWRRIRFRDVITHIAIVSFVAVRPQWQGQGIAARLYDLLLNHLRQRELLVLTFAQAGSAGERAIRRAYPTAGFTLHSLSPLFTYAWMPRPGVEASHIATVRETSNSGLAFARPASGGVLWNAPNSEQLSHYDQDPRAHLSVVREENQVALAGARIVLEKVATARGLTHVPTISSLWVARADAEALRALCAFGIARWGGGPTHSGIQLLNTAGIDPSLVRAAGFRKTGGQFAAYLCLPDPHHPFADAESTNLEVV